VDGRRHFSLRKWTDLVRWMNLEMGSENKVKTRSFLKNLQKRLKRK
jgi:hypothetical protein